MPRTPAAQGGYRLNRKSVFLTYSDAQRIVDAGGKLAIRDFILNKFPAAFYLIGREVHPTTQEPHFHVVIRFNQTIDSTDTCLLDIAGVHPNIAPGAAGQAAEAYCAKEDSDYLTNYWNRSPWTQAANAPNVKEGLDHLWSKCPREMLLHGEQIEGNLTKRLKPVPRAAVQFFGPFAEMFYPPDAWNRDTHSLLILGPAGIGKTQFARYFFGDHEYFKSSPEPLRNATWTKPIICDEFNYLTRDQEQSKEITDVMSGGTLHARYRDILIPPGIQRIFLSNFRCFRNPDNAVYGRRCVVMDLHPQPDDMQFA